MPIYEFECKRCKQIFAKNLPVGEKPKKCKFCSSIYLKRIYKNENVDLKKQIPKVDKPGTVVKEFIENSQQELNELNEEFRNFKI